MIWKKTVLRDVAIKNSSKICSEHFQPNDFSIKGGKRFLNLNAIPMNTNIQASNVPLGEQPFQEEQSQEYCEEPVVDLSVVVVETLVSFCFINLSALL